MTNNQSHLNYLSEHALQELLRSRSWPQAPRVVISGNSAVPWELLNKLDQTLGSYIINGLNVPKGISRRDGVTYETSFVGVGMRHSARLNYIPARLSQVPLLFKTTRVPDIVLLHVSAPKMRGGEQKVSLGIEVNVLPAAIEACRQNGGLIIAQVNPKMPYTYGDGELSVDLFDGFYEAESSVAAAHTPHAAPATPELSSNISQIGDLVASRVTDGSTLQLGIGAVPDATLPGISKRKDLRVWSEMFSDGLLFLDRANALDPAEHVIASFAFGSEELYRWIDSNERIIMKRTEVVNSPANISQQPKMTSINTALQIDLFAQANASRLHARIHSGFGGQTDFIVGALHSSGGQALMALRSWHPKAQTSTIVPILREPTTSFQPTAVITEQGIAEILGQDQKSQAAALIEQAAHPSVREYLWYEARQLGLTVG